MSAINNNNNNNLPSTAAIAAVIPPGSDEKGDTANYATWLENRKEHGRRSFLAPLKLLIVHNCNLYCMQINIFKMNPQ
jgi:hypothetical protein